MRGIRDLSVGLLLGLLACSSGSADETLPTASTVSTSLPAATDETSPPPTPTTTTQQATVTSTPAPSTTASTPSTVPALDSPPWDFTFAELDGLVAIDSPHATDYPVLDRRLTVWAASGGVSDGYLTLRDVPAPAVRSPEGDATFTRIDAPSGDAWLVVDNVDEEPAPSSATRIMWWRDDGRLWIVSNYNVPPESLAELALAIEVAPDGSYTLADPAMTLVGTTDQIAYESMTQAWTLDGLNVSLTVTNGGLTRALNDLAVSDVDEQTVAGMPGYALTLPSGRGVFLVWPTDHPDWWMSMASEALLASRTNDLAAVIVRN